VSTHSEAQETQVAMMRLDRSMTLAGAAAWPLSGAMRSVPGPDTADRTGFVPSERHFNSFISRMIR